MVRWDTFLVLDLRLDIVDRVTWLHIEGNGFAGKRLDKNLHTTTKTQNKMKRGLLLDVVIRQRTTVFQLLADKNQTLLVRWNAFLVLDLRLDVVDGITWFDIEGDCFSGERLDKNLMRVTKLQ